MLACVGGFFFESGICVLFDRRENKSAHTPFQSLILISLRDNTNTSVENGGENSNAVVEWWGVVEIKVRC